ncbi:MAG: B12-binding domain-containing radical SAM protein [bacterium]
MIAKLLFIYPDTVNSALSNLAVHWFFNAFKELEPDLLTKESESGLFFQRDIRKTPFVFVSLSYGPDIVAFAQILKKNNIPLLKQDRDKGIYPIFICGGIAALLNPEPLTLIFDAVFLGEGEEMEKDIINMVSLSTREEVFELINSFKYALTAEKKEALQVTAKENSFFVHSNETLHKLGNCFGNRLIVEMNRGCTSRCKFCAATFAYKKFRTVDTARLLNFVKRNIADKEGIALMGTSLADVECFDEILEICAASNAELSLSSLKISEINEKRVALLKKCGVKTVTVAIESADFKTREKILKKVSDDDIFKAIEILNKNKMKTKLYLIAGFPDTDLEKEAKLVLELLDKLNENRLLCSMTLSVTPLCPKPLTPFESLPFIDKKEYKKYMNTLKKGAVSFGKKVKIDFFSYNESELDYKTGTLKGKEFIKLIEDSLVRK